MKLSDLPISINYEIKFSLKGNKKYQSVVINNVNLFFNLWNEHKDEIRALGLQVFKDKESGKWGAMLWDTPKESTSEQAPIIYKDKITGWESEQVEILEGITLREYQLTNLKKLKKMDWKGCIGDDVGLGKTIQALTVIKNTNAKTVLVVCPKTLIEMWKREIKKYFPTLYFDVTNYEQLKKSRPIAFDLVICDEAHYIKTYDAQRTKAVLQYIYIAKHFIFLSGTLAPNRLSELFVFLACCGEVDKNHNKFMGKYFDKQHFGGYYDNPKASKRDELISLYKNICVRNLQKDVLTELPEKNRIHEKVQTDDKEIAKLMEEYKQLLAKYPHEGMLYDDLINGKMDDNGMGFMQRYRVASEMVKVPIVIEKAKEILDEGKKVVIFSYSKEVQETIYQQFKETHNAVKISSAMNPEERYASEVSFTVDESCKVLVCSMMIAEGMNLQAQCHICLFTGIDWTPKNLIQPEGRLHRMGQKNSVTVYRYEITEIDTKMFEAVERKQRSLSLLDK